MKAVSRSPCPAVEPVWKPALARPGVYTIPKLVCRLSRPKLKMSKPVKPKLPVEALIPSPRRPADWYPTVVRNETGQYPIVMPS